MEGLGAIIEKAAESLKAVIDATIAAFEVLWEALFAEATRFEAEAEELVEAYWKRRRQLEISQAGWDSPARLNISGRADGANPCCKAARMRRCTSATGE